MLCPICRAYFLTFHKITYQYSTNILHEIVQHNIAICLAILHEIVQHNIAIQQAKAICLAILHETVQANIAIQQAIAHHSLAESHGGSRSIGPCFAGPCFAGPLLGALADT
jgi:ubiquitin-protein ligase